jgi:TonB-linked SusC/RagA family outer membrane protein
VSGNITDANGERLPGVNIAVKGTTTGVISDAAGKYSITAPGANAVLTFSFIGYITQEVPVNSRTTIDVMLDEDIQELEEVVVVGYGVQRKSDVTGAVVSVSDEKLRDRPVVNMLEALQGKAAGVDITNNVRPGEFGTVRIRGQRSITGSSNPLYVVNGIPIQGRNDNSNDNNNSANIAWLNPNDIKSVDILKDASATAIYGSRGANGVVLITTYSGEDGRFSVNYSGSTTVSELQDSREFFNSGEWIDFVRWAHYYSNRETYPTADNPTLLTDQMMFGGDPYAWRNVEKGWDGGSWDGSKVATTDWTKYAIQTGITQNHTVSVSGGTSKVSSYISLGYLDEKGTSQGQSYDRYTLNINSTAKPVDWFELGGRINGSWQDQQYGQDRTGASSTSGPTSIYASALRLYPYAVPYDDNGERIIFPGSMASLKTVVDEVEYSHNNRQILNAIGNLYAQVKLPLDGLTYRPELGINFRYRFNGVYIDPNSAIRENSESLVQLSNQRDFTWTVNNIVNYNKTFGMHNVLLTLLQTASKNEQTESRINGKNVPVPSSLWHAMGSLDRTNDITGVESSLSEEQLASYMARINYNLKDRYLLTLSGRWDGSSVLAAGHKWAFFPSGSLGWRIEQEDFLKPLTWINQLKLRLGFGVVGNAAVSRYSTKGSIFSALYPYGEDLERFYFVNDLMATSSRNTLPNLQLGWEKTAQYNLGLDFSILKNRITGTLEFYTSRTTDLLLNSNIPSLTGYITTTANVGETKNKGAEITLNTFNLKIASGFTWETSFSVAWQKNEIVELSNGKEDEVANTRFIGQPIGVYYNYKAIGIWREEDKAEMEKFNSDVHPVTGEAKTPHNFQIGQTRVEDQNGDYVIDANHDRVIIGQTGPEWTGGMANTFSWKGIELMIQMYGRMGYWTDGGQVSMGGKYMLRKVDYYNENNKNAPFQRPQLTTDGSDADSYSATLQYSKASFVNIRNISLSYSLPKKLIKNWGGMQNLKVYAQIVNPGAVYQSVDWKNMDLNSSIWNRNFVFGLNVGF